MQNDEKYHNADGSKKTNPETGQAYKHTDLMAAAGAMWNALDDAAKKKYEDLAAADKARHEK